MTITDISPINVKPGDTVTIRGSGFGTTISAVGFTFHLGARVITWRNDLIQCIVPEGAVSGPVVIRIDTPTFAVAGVVKIANGPSQPPPPPPPDDRISTELAQINALRQAHGVGTLVLNDQLMKSAQSYAELLERTAEFSHFLNGTTPGSRAAAAGYPSQFVGENIAKGFFSVDSVMNAWEHSPEHLQNLLLPNYTEIGLGVSGSSWVEDFGARLSGSLPFGNENWSEK